MSIFGHLDGTDKEDVFGETMVLVNNQRCNTNPGKYKTAYKSPHKCAKLQCLVTKILQKIFLRRAEPSPDPSTWGRGMLMVKEW